jgi:ribose transport system substrate-binding protein
MRGAITAFAVVTGVAVLAACSSGSSSSTSASSTSAAGASDTGSSAAAAIGKVLNVDVGGGYTLRWKTGQPLKIAFFQFATNNGWTVSEVNAAKAEAAKVGASLTVFDAQSSPQNQFNQMQTALNTGDYNAWMYVPTDGTLICNIVSKLAPAKGIAVIQQQAGICGNDNADGAAARQPGEFGYVGGNGDLSTWTAFTNYVCKANAKPTNAIVLSGPAGSDTTNVSNQAFKAMAKTCPQIHIVETLPTLFTEQDGFNLTQQAMQQHPDVGVIMSVYSGTTQGAVKALQAAHLQGKVKLYDQGGDSESVTAIKAGIQSMTMPLFPASQASVAVSLLNMLNTGQVSTPQVRLNDGSTLGGTNGAPYFVDNKNVSSFVAEYH